MFPVWLYDIILGLSLGTTISLILINRKLLKLLQKHDETTAPLLGLHVQLTRTVSALVLKLNPRGWADLSPEEMAGVEETKLEMIPLGDTPREDGMRILVK